MCYLPVYCDFDLLNSRKLSQNLLNQLNYSDDWTSETTCPKWQDLNQLAEYFKCSPKVLHCIYINASSLLVKASSTAIWQPFFWDPFKKFPKETEPFYVFVRIYFVCVLYVSLWPEE